MAMGCTGVWTQRGVSITGRRSTRYRRISKAAPPEPRIMAARKKVVGTVPDWRIRATSKRERRCSLRLGSSAPPNPPR